MQGKVGVVVRWTGALGALAGLLLMISFHVWGGRKGEPARPQAETPAPVARGEENQEPTPGEEEMQGLNLPVPFYQPAPGRYAPAAPPFPFQSELSRQETGVPQYPAGAWNDAIRAAMEK